MDSIPEDLMGEATSILDDPIQQTKLLASLVLFVITLLCGYLPVRMLLNQNYVQHAMFAGGGVLMATAFCHLIPEAHDNYKSSQAGGGGHSHSHSHFNQHPSQPASQIGDAHNHTMPNISTTTNTSTTTTTTTLAANHQHENHHHHHHQHQANSSDSLAQVRAHLQGLNVPYIEVTLCCGFFFMYLVEQLMVKFINNHTHEHPCDSAEPERLVGVGVLQSDTQSSNGGGASSSVGNLSSSPIVPAGRSAGDLGNLRVSDSGSAMKISSTSGATELYKFFRGLLIISAFGAHSIFDGVAIGSQKSTAEVWTIFVAISCHKLIIAAVVGLELFAATLESHLWTLVHLVIFSIMSPIGIILIVVAQNSLNIDSNHPTMILLQSFATGTLLYIIFVEILQPKDMDSYENKNNKLAKSFSLIAGFGLMLLVLTVMDE